MPSRVSSPVFVGRHEELRLLDEAIRQAVAGEPALVLVGGEAGVGKTRLLGEATDRARRDHDARVLVGGCLDLGEATLPYAPLVEAIRDLARQLGTDRLRAVLGPARRPLARLLPELDRSAPDGARGDEAGSQAGLFEEVLGVVGRLAAERPLVLAFEDLHWADRATLDLLVFLTHNLRDERTLLVGTFRSELHRRHPLRPVLGELGRLPVTVRLEMPRFDRRELAEQAAAILDVLPDDRLLDDVLARSEGNPFYAEELLAVARTEGGADRLPDTLREILIDRVTALPQAARRVLRVAAAVGRDVDDRLLGEVADLPAGELGDGLREAVAHQMLVTDGTTLRFRHALLQEAVHADLLPHEQIALHAAVAAALERRPDLAGGGPDAVHGELAHHWYAAHDMTRAFVASVAAAGHAYALYAFTEAQHHYERALALWDHVPAETRDTTISRPDLLSRAAATATYSGDARRALGLQRDAIAAALDVEPGTHAKLVEELSFLHWSAGQGQEALAVVEDALEAFPAEPSEGRARLLARRGRLLMLSSRHAEAIAVSRDAAGIARTVGARPMEGRALNTLGTSLAASGHTEEGIAHLRAALDVALDGGDAGDVNSVFANLSWSLAEAGRFEEAYELALEGVRWFEERGTTGPLPHFIRLNAIQALHPLGRWTEADQLFAQATLGRGDDFVAISHALTGAVLRTGQGRFEEAQRYIERGLGLTRDVVDAQSIAPIAAAEMELACWRNRPLDAAPAVGRVLVLGEQIPWSIHRFLPAAARAQAEIAGSTDDPTVAARARATLVDLLDRARQALALMPEGTHRELRLRAALATAEAELTRLDGRSDHDAWRQAVEANDASGVVYAVACARWRLAESILHADGDRAEVARELAVAHAVADRLGAAPLREAVEALARRARIALPGVSAGGDDGLGLTPREREVLALVAAGRSNRQIAEALFISAKTASVHVSNILAKLEVASRGEAAAVAHRRGLVAVEATSEGSRARI